MDEIGLVRKEKKWSRERKEKNDMDRINIKELKA